MTCLLPNNDRVALPPRAPKAPGAWWARLSLTWTLSTTLRRSCCPPSCHKNHGQICGKVPCFCVRLSEPALRSVLLPLGRDGRRLPCLSCVLTSATRAWTTLAHLRPVQDQERPFEPSPESVEGPRHGKGAISLHMENIGRRLGQQAKSKCSNANVSKVKGSPILLHKRLFFSV